MKRFYNDLKQYYKYAIFSAKSELKAEVANSYLNWLWWILDPICFMLIYSFIFGYVFNGSEPYFPIFIFIGLTAWDFFNRNTVQSVKMLQNNKSIITKVYIPKFILIASKMMVNGFKMFVSFGVVVFMMIFYQVHISYKILYVIPILLVLFIITFACMSFLLHYGVFVEDLSNIIHIVLRLLFYITGVFYSVQTRLPEPYGSYALKLNPIALILDSLRKSVLYGETPARKLLLVWGGIGLMFLILGIKKIYKNENTYVKVM